MTEFDVVVIGGGPGGYVAAIRAAQLGFKTACVEKRKTLGGTCLNVGCIPSKALLHSSHLFEEASHGAAHGITGTITLDLAAMMKRKENVVADLCKGIDGLFAKNKVTRYFGHGIVLGKGEVAVKPDGKGAPESLKAKHIILATGSEVTPLPGVESDEKRIISSTGGLALSEVPKRLAVIGGGVIGLELGSVWRRLGAEVTVIEYLDGITPGQDAEIARQFQKILEKQGMKFILGTKVTSAKSGAKEVMLTYEPAKGGKAETLKADAVLVAIGRRPYTQNLGLKEAGVALDERGRVKVDAHYATSAPGIYAIGDLIPGPMLAHKAEEDGVACVEMLAGQKPHVDYNLVPGVIYTNPELASVGKTEEQLKAAGVAYSVGKFPFLANSRARTMGDTDGLVKILADAKTDRVLGVHILGQRASDLIAECVTIMEYKGSAEDIARCTHSHPTLSEAVGEAARMAWSGNPINS